MLRRCLFAALFGAMLLPALAGAGDGEAVKPLEAEKAEKFSRLFDEILKKADKAWPVKVSPDYKRSVGLVARKAGALAAPDAKLTAAALKSLDKGTLPVAVLYLHKITVVANDEAVPVGQHRTIDVSVDGKEANLTVVHLAAARVAGRLVLLAYTDSDTPLLVASLFDVEAGDAPIELDARPAGDSRAVLVVTVAGKYRASIPLAAQP